MTFSIDRGMLWESLNCSHWGPSGQLEPVAGLCSSCMAGLTSWQHPYLITWTSLDHQDGSLWGLHLPSSNSPCHFSKGLCWDLCAAKTQLLSGWEQPGFLLHAFGYAGNQPLWSGTEHRKQWRCKSNQGVPEVLYLSWPLQEHCLLCSMCLLSPEDQEVMLDKNMLNWYLFLPFPKQPSGSHQSWRCDASGTRSWVIIWGRIAKLSTGLTISIIR